MKCSYCGANADQNMNYCYVCGAKLTHAEEAAAENPPIELKEDITEQPEVSAIEYPRTRAALIEIFGPEEDWPPPPEEVASLPAEEEWDFPVTPCAEWMPEKAEDEDCPPAVYTTAPLREDVMPQAPVQTPAHAAAAETAKEEVLPFENMLKLPADRSFVKMVLLGLLTIGIYPAIIWSQMVTELNIVAGRNDGKRTMPYFGMLILAPFTLFVFFFVWMHKFCNRVGGQLEFRKCECKFGARDFWIWGVLGCLILVGPFIFTNKLIKAMNSINSHYNACGW